MTTEERFWAKVNKDGPTVRPELGPCWVWSASRSDGYGDFFFNRRPIKAHRFCWELLKGPVPVGLELDHLCRVRHCVNPGHLEPVTTRENTLRGEGVTAMQARKTHCKRGHEFTPENTRIEQTKSPWPHRCCRACERARELGRVRDWSNRKRRKQPPRLYLCRYCSSPSRHPKWCKRPVGTTGHET